MEQSSLVISFGGASPVRSAKSFTTPLRFSRVRFPITSETRNRLGTSMAVKSHCSPLSWSAGDSSSQCFCFFSHEGPLLVELDLLYLQASRPFIMEALGVQAKTERHR